MLSFCICLSILTGCGSSPKNDQTQQKATETQMAETEQDTSLEDGEYTANVKLEGGSGRASVDSDAKIKVTDGQAYATIVWSSSHYDYMRLYHPVFHFLRNAADTAVSGALVFAGRHRILRSYKRCCAAFHLCLHQTDKISSGSVIPVMGRIVRHFSGLFHPSPDRPLAPELCITENNPLTVNRWMLYSFTLPGHPHLKLKYW